ncbi:hypothetical protein JCM8097_003101 [Rhodosporidiobolus ruineniae]
MARDGSQGPSTAVNGLARQGSTGPRASTPAAAQPALSTSTQPPSANSTNKRVALADKNIAMISLPSQDRPAYYDSPEDDDDDDPLSDDALPAPDLDDHWLSDSDTHALSLHPTRLPLTNRGHKLSRAAPHTRRHKLGTHAHVDVGFPDPLQSRAALVPPAQKRRKLNDLAPPSSSASASTGGFPVAPNLHLVPRGVHALSRDPDTPAGSYLPPAAQSPLDLLLQPAVQHTLGKRNASFFNLAMSATGLIEQEAELVQALTDVCRGLRGEGFEWRWEGDEERKKEREERMRREEEERVRKAEEQARRREEERERRREADEARLAREAEEADQAATAAAAQQPAPALNDPDASAVKLEQETPVLAAAVAPAAPSNPVAVPGLSAAAPTAGAGADAGSGEDVDMTPAEDASSSAGASSAQPAQPAPAAPGLAGLPPLPPAIPPVVAADAAAPAPDAAVTAVPAIAVTADGSAPPAPVPAEATPHPVAAAPNGEAISGLPVNGGEDVSMSSAVAPVPSASGEIGTVDLSASTSSAAAPPAVASNGDLLAAPSTEVTPAPSLAPGTGSGLEGSEEPSLRRRSGRVAGRGTGGARHTRSRQSSPEEGDWDSAGELDGVDGGAGGAEGEYDLEAGEQGGSSSAAQQAAARLARAPLVPEDPLPAYAARLVDPEGFVRSRFVTEGTVEMERMAQGPHGGVVGTGVMEGLTANEQEVLLHDCLTDLHRFLADTLEYRARLGEIRDGVLGVERRRKGMWKVVRTVAMDWLVEEGAGAAGGGGGGGGYEGYE